MSRQGLALGTAQFGLDYGVTNRAGRLDDAAVAALLDVCEARGVRMLDTAGGYGDSEQRVGAALRGRRGTWQVVTKTPAAGQERIDAPVLARFSAAWAASRDRLGDVDALLVHHADDLLKPGAEALLAWLRERRDEGEVARVGVSVYDEAQLDALLERHGRERNPFDVIQLPANIADPRFAHSAIASALHGAGAEIHVRSLFLQGLLLSPADAAFAGEEAVAWLSAFHREVQGGGRSPLEACMAFFRSVPHFDVAVVGATSAHELSSIADAFDGAAGLGSPWRPPQGRPRWVDPRTWRPR